MKKLSISSLIKESSLGNIMQKVNSQKMKIAQEADMSKKEELLRQLYVYLNSIQEEFQEAVDIIAHEKSQLNQKRAGNVMQGFQQFQKNLKKLK